MGEQQWGSSYEHVYKCNHSGTVNAETSRMAKRVLTSEVSVFHGYYGIIFQVGTLYIVLIKGVPSQ